MDQINRQVEVQNKKSVNKAEKVINVNQWPYNFNGYDDYLRERTSPREENTLMYAKYLFMRSKGKNAPRKKTTNKRKRVVENKAMDENTRDDESDDEVEMLDAATCFRNGITNSSVPSHRNMNIDEYISEEESDDVYISEEVSDDVYISEEESDDGIEKLDADEFFKIGGVDENTLESETDDDVEILEADVYMREGAFVPSTTFDKTTMEEEFEIFGGTDAHNVYREKVMDIIGKPFDKEEYTSLQETIRGGKYLDHHPDLRRKLKKYRNNKGKRLNMFLGYFFWLQNLMHEGSFKPWNDGDCLAVDPPFL